jgi:glycosyltransferase involved in cell wall biosynthesis
MSRVKLLCSISNLNGGGAERVMLYLLAHLPAAGFDVTLALGARSGQFASLIPPHIPVIELGTERGYRAVLPMRDLLKSNRWDVSFSMTSFNMTAALARRLAPKTRTKLAFGARNHYSSALAREATLPHLRKALVRFLYPMADLVIAVAEGTRDDLIEHFGLPPERVETINNPVDLEFVRAQAKEEIPDPWLSGDVPVILNVGKLMEAKGQLVLLEAFRRVLKKVDARLMILGVGPLQHTLETAARDWGISEKVRFAGFHMNPYAFMARATTFVLASSWEGFPNVLVEAMATGAAVVSTRCPSGPAEIIRPEESGLLVPTRDPERMAVALIRILQDGKLRDRLRHGATKEVERFAVDQVVARYAETFSRLAATGA